MAERTNAVAVEEPADELELAARVAEATPLATSATKSEARIVPASEDPRFHAALRVSSLLAATAAIGSMPTSGLGWLALVATSGVFTLAMEHAFPGPFAADRTRRQVWRGVVVGQLASTSFWLGLGWFGLGAPSLELRAAFVVVFAPPFFGLLRLRDGVPRPLRVGAPSVVFVGLVLTLVGSMLLSPHGAHPAVGASLGGLLVFLAGLVARRARKPREEPSTSATTALADYRTTSAEVRAPGLVDAGAIAEADAVGAATAVVGAGLVAESLGMRTAPTIAALALPLAWALASARSVKSTTSSPSRLEAPVVTATITAALAAGPLALGASWTLALPLALTTMLVEARLRAWARQDARSLGPLASFAALRVPLVSCALALLASAAALPSPVRIGLAVALAVQALVVFVWGALPTRSERSEGATNTARSTTGSGA